MLNEKEKKQLEELLSKMNAKEIRECSEKIERVKKLSLESYKVGNKIEFGRYYSGYTDEEIAPICWRILDIREEEGKALLISEYALDSMPYHPVCDNISWERSSLRNWLNTVFISTAFNEDEKGKIAANGVLIPSEEELDKYMPKASEKACFASIWCLLKPVTHFVDSTRCSYFLRTEGKPSTMASVVNPMGQVIHNRRVDTARIGIRPAMWVMM